MYTVVQGIRSSKKKLNGAFVIFTVWIFNAVNAVNIIENFKWVFIYSAHWWFSEDNHIPILLAPAKHKF